MINKACLLKINFMYVIAFLLLTMFAWNLVGAEKSRIIKPFDLQPTEAISMSKKQFRKFVADVKDNGLKEPIKYVEHNGEKYVVDGHHRLRAAKMLGMDKVPAEPVNLPYRGYKEINDLFGYFGP